MFNLITFAGSLCHVKLYSQILGLGHVPLSRANIQPTTGDMFNLCTFAYNTSRMRRLHMTSRIQKPLVKYFICVSTWQCVQDLSCRSFQSSQQSVGTPELPNDRSLGVATWWENYLGNLLWSCVFIESLVFLHRGRLRSGVNETFVAEFFLSSLLSSQNPWLYHWHY